MRRNLDFWPIENLKGGTVSMISHSYDKVQNISYPQVSVVSLTLPLGAQSRLKPLKIVREQFWRLE